MSNVSQIKPTQEEREFIRTGDRLLKAIEPHQRNKNFRRWMELRTIAAMAELGVAETQKALAWLEHQNKIESRWARSLRHPTKRLYRIKLKFVGRVSRRDSEAHAARPEVQAMIARARAEYKRHHPEAQL